MASRLLYVMDPMCSWCWGFAPVGEALVEQAHAAGVELHLVVGGLRTGSGSALEPTTRRYILEHWQAVTQATGQLSSSKAHCRTVLSTTPSLPAGHWSRLAAWPRTWPGSW